MIAVQAREKFYLSQFNEARVVQTVNDHSISH